jgi:hypothetical protein
VDAPHLRGGGRGRVGGRAWLRPGGLPGPPWSRRRPAAALRDRRARCPGRRPPAGAAPPAPAGRPGRRQSRGNPARGSASGAAGWPWSTAGWRRCRCPALGRGMGGAEECARSWLRRAAAPGQGGVEPCAFAPHGRLSPQRSRAAALDSTRPQGQGRHHSPKRRAGPARPPPTLQQRRLVIEAGVAVGARRRRRRVGVRRAVVLRVGAAAVPLHRGKPLPAHGPLGGRDGLGPLRAARRPRRAPTDSGCAALAAPCRPGRGRSSPPQLAWELRRSSLRESVSTPGQGPACEEASSC